MLVALSATQPFTARIAIRPISLGCQVFIAASAGMPLRFEAGAARLVSAPRGGGNDSSGAARAPPTRGLVNAQVGHGGPLALQLREPHPPVQEEVEHLLQQVGVDAVGGVLVVELRELAAPVRDVVFALDAPGTAIGGQPREVLGAEGGEEFARDAEDLVDLVARFELPMPRVVGDSQALGGVGRVVHGALIHMEEFGAIMSRADAYIYRRAQTSSVGRHLQGVAGQRHQVRRLTASSSAWATMSGQRRPV